MPVSNIGFIFIALSVIFLGAALKNYLQSKSELTPARQTWIRIAFIFAAVGIILSFYKRGF
jgi:hypothetical protein